MSDTHHFSTPARSSPCRSLRNDDGIVDPDNPVVGAVLVHAIPASLPPSLPLPRLPPCHSPGLPTCRRSPTRTRSGSLQSRASEAAKANLRYRTVPITLSKATTTAVRAYRLLTAGHHATLRCTILHSMSLPLIYTHAQKSTTAAELCTSRRCSTARPLATTSTCTRVRVVPNKRHLTFCI